MAALRRQIAIAAALVVAVDGGMLEDADCEEKGGECDASSLLQHTRLGRQRSTLPHALVDAVFTYGAPATSEPALKNAASEDGCFRGLRVYNERRAKGSTYTGTDKTKGTLQVDAASMFNALLSHGWIDALQLGTTDDMLSDFAPCNFHRREGEEWPQRAGNKFAEWRVHGENEYVTRLQGLKIGNWTGNPLDYEPFHSSLMFTTLAWRTYDYENISNVTHFVEKDMPGWRLVLATTDKHQSDWDPVMITQHEDTLDCALAFTGTNAFFEMFTSTTSHPGPYCGFEKVHTGYKNEVWTIVNRTWGVVRPKLEQCNKVTCVGHSLGGSICEIFAACANSGHTTHPDYQALAWTPGTPRLMEKTTVLDQSPIEED